jgi:hypothetical protein
MNPLLLSLFVGSGVFLFFAITMFHKTKELTNEAFITGFQKDFIATKNAIKYVNGKDGDRIIDNFEARWINKVESSYLLYHIGKLIEEQCLYLQKG